MNIDIEKFAQIQHDLSQAEFNFTELSKSFNLNNMKTKEELQGEINALKERNAFLEREMKAQKRSMVCSRDHIKRVSEKVVAICVASEKTGTGVSMNELKQIEHEIDTLFYKK